VRLAWGGLVQHSNRKSTAKRRGNVIRVVGTAIVDDEEFPVVRGRQYDARQFVERPPQVLGAVPGADSDRKLHAASPEDAFRVPFIRSSIT